MAAMTLLSFVSLAVVGGVTLYSYQIIARQFTVMEQYSIPGVLFVETMRGDVAGIILETSDVAATGDVTQRERLSELLAEVQESAAEHTARAAGLGEEEARVAQEVEDDVGRIVTLANQAVAALEAGASSDDVASMISQMGDEGENLEPILDEYLAEHLSELAAAEAAVESARRNATLATWVMILIAVPAAAGLAFVISRLLTRQVDELRKVFRGVIVGNFESRAAVLGKDELGEVADGMNAMLTLLANLLAETGQLADQRLAILDTTTDFVGITNLDASVTYLNPAALGMSGRVGQDPLSLAIPDFHPPDINQMLTETAIPIVMERGIWAGDSAILHTDGTRIPISQVIMLIRDETGAPQALATIARDITEQRQAEEALQQSEQLLRSVLDATPDWIFAKDRDFRYLLANKSFASAIGTTPEQMVGKDDLEVGFPEELVFGNPERGIHGFRTDDQAVLEQGEMLHNPHDPAITAAGEEVIFDTYKMPLRDDKGEVWAALGVARDVTERKAAEASLAQQKAVLDTTTDFVGIARMDGSVIYLNSAALEMSGRTGQDPLSLSIPDFYPPDINQMLSEVAIPTTIEQGIWSGDSAILRTDGVRIPISQVVMLIRDENGDPIGLATIARDISEQRQVITDVEGAATQVTDASSEMAEIVRLMVDQAASSAEVAGQAAASAHEGDRVVGETMAAMERIRDNTQESARRLKRLGEVSQEINEAVRLIDEIADRTTVLALNASIQAAAAGEAGRGFAVVAEEVQRLAERATGATRQIEDLVKGIQAETNEAAVGMEEATREVVEGSQLAQQAGERMAELNELVGDLSSLIQHVAETTAQQTNQSVTTLADLSQNLMASVAGFGTTDGGDRGDGSGTQ